MVFEYLIGSDCTTFYVKTILQSTELDVMRVYITRVIVNCMPHDPTKMSVGIAFEISVRHAPGIREYGNNRENQMIA